MKVDIFTHRNFIREWEEVYFKVRVSITEKWIVINIDVTNGRYFFLGEMYYTFAMAWLAVAE